MYNTCTYFLKIHKVSRVSNSFLDKNLNAIKNRNEKVHVFYKDNFKWVFKCEIEIKDKEKFFIVTSFPEIRKLFSESLDRKQYFIPLMLIHPTVLWISKV